MDTRDNEPSGQIVAADHRDVAGNSGRVWNPSYEFKSPSDAGYSADRGLNEAFNHPELAFPIRDPQVRSGISDERLGIESGVGRLVEKDGPLGTVDLDWGRSSRRRRTL